MSEDGHGVEADRDQALQWYRAAKSSPDADEIIIAAVTEAIERLESGE